VAMMPRKIPSSTSEAKKCYKQAAPGDSLNSLYSSFMSGACTPIRRHADTPIRSKYVCR
jgi:hypothetical protein